jgi:hypothetical protein
MAQLVGSDEPSARALARVATDSVRSPGQQALATLSRPGGDEVVVARPPSSMLGRSGLPSPRGDGRVFSAGTVGPQPHRMPLASRDRRGVRPASGLPWSRVLPTGAAGYGIKVIVTTFEDSFERNPKIAGGQPVLADISPAGRRRWADHRATCMSGAACQTRAEERRGNSGA